MIQAAPPPAVSPAEAIDAAKVAWLQAHEVGGGPVAGPLQLHLPDDLLRARLILVGESHGSAAPQVVDLALLTELNRRVGLRDYVAEVDPVQAQALNLYLDTGEEAVLTRIFSLWKNKAQWGNTAFMDKVRGVRALNQGLPPARRIRFTGLDAIQDWPMLLDWLEDAGAKVDPSAIEAAPNEATKAQLAATWLAGAAGGEPRLKARLAQTLALIGRKAPREEVLFETYATAVRSGELGTRPAYGLWGMFHVLQAPMQGGLPFAARVKASNLPAAASMRSIVLQALDSATLIPGRTTGVRMTNLNADGPVIRVQGIGDLRAASRPQAVTLWRLAGSGSPYSRGDAGLVTMRSSLGQSLLPADASRPTTTFFQYAGVFSGSNWAPPIP